MKDPMTLYNCLQKEKDNLKTKLNKLEEFINNSDDFFNLTESYKALLIKQRNAMEEYYKILLYRTDISYRELNHLDNLCI